MSDRASPATNLALTCSAEELNRQSDWFFDATRSSNENLGPFVRVIDNFYSAPLDVRRLALDMQFVQYSPPRSEYAGETLARAYSDLPGKWYATANLVFRGNRLQAPFEGRRYNTPEVCSRLERLIGEEILRENWEMGGDGWNGAFHLIEDGRPHSSIHHHYRTGDVKTRGWTGVVYLSPDAPPNSGTSIWRDRNTGLCIAPFGSSYHSTDRNFELALNIENVFNRLVLIRENVLHRGEYGFGFGKDSRLTQTFFFESSSL